MYKTHNLFTIFFLISLVLISTEVYAGVAFLNSKISSDVVDLDNNINFFYINNTVVNYDDQIRADLVIVYSLINTKDSSELIVEEMIFSLGAFEVKDFSKKFIIPKTAAGGDYKLIVLVKGPNDTPLAGFPHKIKIINSNVEKKCYFAKGPYLKIPMNNDPNQIIYQESWGAMGNNVPQNSTFYLKFDIKNENNKYNNLKAVIDFIPTFSNKSIYNFEQILDNFSSPDFVQNYEIPLNFDKPGTYKIVVSIYDGDDYLSQKEVRLVISGESASILRVKNKQDVYKIGDSIKISADLVGPADGATKLEDVYFKLLLSQNDALLKEITKNIPKLGFNVISESFELISNWSLEKYKVKLILGKGDKIFDEVVINYEPLKVEKMISPDGRVYSSNKPGCFDDNKCTPQEREFGNCYDCWLEDKPKPVEPIVEDKKEKPIIEKSFFSENKEIIISVILMIMIILMLLFIWNKKKEVKYNE